MLRRTRRWDSHRRACPGGMRGRLASVRTATPCSRESSKRPCHQRYAVERLTPAARDASARLDPAPKAAQVRLANWPALPMFERQRALVLILSTVTLMMLVPDVEARRARGLFLSGIRCRWSWCLASVRQIRPWLSFELCPASSFAASKVCSSHFPRRPPGNRPDLTDADERRGRRSLVHRNGWNRL